VRCIIGVLQARCSIIVSVLLFLSGPCYDMFVVIVAKYTSYTSDLYTRIQSSTYKHQIYYNKDLLKKWKATKNNYTE
jgi:hypothetical protein